MGPSLFQPHQARQAIRDAHEKRIPPLIGYYAGVAAVPITRWLAPMGYDYVWIDWEHSAMNVETMTTVWSILSAHRSNELTLLRRWSTRLHFLATAALFRSFGKFLEHLSGFRLVEEQAGGRGGKNGG